MTPQVQSAWVRGIVETLIVAAATGGGAVCTHILTGDSTKTAIVAGIGLACSTLLGRLGEGKLDANRAARVARNDLAALRPSDVGYEAAKRHIETCIVAHPPA